MSWDEFQGPATESIKWNKQNKQTNKKQSTIPVNNLKEILMCAFTEVPHVGLIYTQGLKFSFLCANVNCTYVGSIHIVMEVHGCACVYGGLEWWFWDRLSETWSSLIRLGWLATELQGSSVLRLSDVSAGHTCFYVGCGGRNHFLLLTKQILPASPGDFFLWKHLQN